MNMLDYNIAKKLHELILWDCKRKKDGTPIYPSKVYLSDNRFFLTNPSKHAKALRIDLNTLQVIKISDILEQLKQANKA